MKLRNGKKVEGWLHAKTPLDKHVALDEEANDIHLIPLNAQESISY